MSEQPAITLVEPKTLRKIEKEAILHVLAKHGGHKPPAAKELGIALKTLYNKLNQYRQSESRESP